MGQIDEKASVAASVALSNEVALDPEVDPTVLTLSERSVLLRVVGLGEDVVHFIVALLLLGVSTYVLVRTIAEAISHDASFAERVIGVINGVLFVIIVMEIMKTVLAHFERGGFQLKPFLIIGIISAVRHILTVGAQLSLGVDGEGQAFMRSQIELAINGGLVIVLVLGLVLVQRFEVSHD